MKIQPTSLSLVAVFLATASACGGNRLLVGDGPTGTAGTGGGLSGTAGTGNAGATGAAGTTGAAGVVGAAGGTGFAGGTVTGAGGGGGTGETRVVTPLRISGTEAVTRIAAVLLHDAPDADLMLQASQGRFTSTSDLYGAVHQMLVDPRAATGVGAFYRWWLNLDVVTTLMKDGLLYPEFAAAKGDIAKEPETFGVNVTLAMNGSYATLLTAPFSFINARLAGIYGVANVSGDELRQVSLDPTQRAGLLTQPALQVLSSPATNNEPSLRGAKFDTTFLCQKVPVSPPGVGPALAPAAGVSMRQALAMSVNAQANCAACHSLIDPPGLAFETFDAIGRWRTTDNGVPVDVSGLQILNLNDATVSVNGPVELAQAVAHSPRAEECMVQQWYAFVLGKTPAEIDYSLSAVTLKEWGDSGFTLKELIASVLTSDAFLAPR